MHSVFQLCPAKFAAGLILFGFSSSIFALEPDSGLAAVQELPEAPQAQFARVEAEPFPAGQSQTSTAQDTSNSQPSAPEAQRGSISGTVTDVNEDIVSGATVNLDGPLPGDHRTAVADDKGSFSFGNLRPGIPYHIAVSGKGFISWTSPAVILTPGQYLFLTDCRLKISGGETSVTVVANSEQIATEQVKIEEQQRVFGIIPNFYVVYDHNPVPLTTKLKFKLALRTSIDPVTFVAVGFSAGIDQAADTPDYVLGAKGYGQRFGATYANGVSDILFGGAILPSLLHQDPRYYYQGTGTKKSRARHALLSPFICKGDNGRSQPNYSSIGGDLIASSLSNAYYPDSNRGVGLVFKNFGIDTGERMVSTLVQEFVLRKFTSKAKNRD
jgi:hypothetical protein